MTVLKLTNVTTFVYSCCSNNNFIWSNKPVIFYTPLFLRQKSQSNCQWLQPTPQHSRHDSAVSNHRTLNPRHPCGYGSCSHRPWVLSHHHRWTGAVGPRVRKQRYIDNNLIFTDLLREPCKLIKFTDVAWERSAFEASVTISKLHGVISEKTWIVSNIAVKTLHLAIIWSLFLNIHSYCYTHDIESGGNYIFWALLEHQLPFCSGPSLCTRLHG